MEASGQNGDTPPPDLSPDVATARRSTDTSDAVALTGYLGEGSSDHYRRLYENLAFNRWIEIPAADIVDRVAAAGGDDPTAGQSIVWVRRDAQVVAGEAVHASRFEGPLPEPGPPWGPGPPPPGRWPRP
jgi:hypothetical protein